MLNDLWQSRLLELCNFIATWSKDPSNKVGCVIVDRDKRIISTGYNGFPKGVADLPERYENRDLKYPIVRHAEENAISFAKQSLEGAILVCTLHPCARCAGAIIQAGITHVVCYEPNADYVSRWKNELNIASMMFMEAGVQVSCGTLHFAEEKSS